MFRSKKGADEISSSWEEWKEIINDTTASMAD
jgi:hypothetical protein